MVEPGVYDVTFRRGEDSSEEREIKRWERFRDAAAQEKQWMHDRLSWLFTSQGILFAALALTLMKKDDVDSLLRHELRIAIPLVGLLVSVCVFGGVLAACRMHWLWTTRVNDLAANLNQSGNASDVPFGSEPHWPAHSSSVLPGFLALVFVVTWAVMVVCSFYPDNQVVSPAKGVSISVQG